MNENFEELKKMAQEKMENIRQCMEKTKSEVESSFELSRSEIEHKIEQIRGELKAKKEKAKTTKDKIKAEAIQHKEQLRAQISHLTETAYSKMEAKRCKDIIKRAEKAQHYAGICMDVAAVSIVEAQLACLEACRAQAEAQEVLSQSEAAEKST